MPKISRPSVLHGVKVNGRKRRKPKQADPPVIIRPREPPASPEELILKLRKLNAEFMQFSQKMHDILSDLTEVLVQDETIPF